MSLPESYAGFLGRFSPPWLATLSQAFDDEPSVAVRLNRRKRAAAGVLPAAAARRVPWCDAGFLLDRRPAFTFDPLLHQGAYYVQDASSMFVGHVVRSLTAGATAPVVALDACAAPGGKTTALIDALPPRSVVVANEFVPQRAAVLRENLAKWGYPLVAVTQGDTKRFRADARACFDLVLADVPCSGEGMMRKDAEAVRQWSARLVEQCVERQREIVDNLWPALRPGGYMIYSTCTFNPLENERMLHYLRDRHGAEPVAVPVEAEWGIAPELEPLMPAYRFVPGLIEGEGLFVGVVRKPLDDSAEPAGAGSGPSKKRRPDRKAKGGGDPRMKAAIAAVASWLSADYEAAIAVEGDTLYAEFASGLPFAARLELGTLKGRDVVPSQQLALSQALRADAFPRVEVDWKQAVDYLRCEAIALADAAPRGIVLLTYGGLPLGFVKNLGNRANNLYPKSWRILSQRPAARPFAGV